VGLDLAVDRALAEPPRHLGGANRSESSGKLQDYSVLIVIGVAAED
jgi:hypothetical protein